MQPTDYSIGRRPGPRLGAMQKATPGMPSRPRVAPAILGLVIGIGLSFIVASIQPDRASRPQQTSSALDTTAAARPIAQHTALHAFEPEALIGFVLLSSPTHAFAEGSVGAATGSPPPCDPRVELAKALAWPLIAVVIALVYREPLGRFFRSLGERATRLSLFNVELELTAAHPPASAPMLEDIQHAPSSAQISDSSRALLDQVQGTAPADYALIDLGAGEEWITTRLFIAALMLERMRGLQCLVFTEQLQATDRRLVAVATPAQVRWGLARRFPWLEVAFVRANAEAQPTGGRDQLPDPKLVTAQASIVKSNTGALDPFMARQVVARFVELVQSGPAAGTQVPPAAPSHEWITLSGGNLERAAWVTRPLLRELLPDEAFGAWAGESREQPRATRSQAVLSLRGATFVALVDPDRGFSRLIDRRALLEEVAARLEQ